MEITVSLHMEFFSSWNIHPLLNRNYAKTIIRMEHANLEQGAILSMKSVNLKIIRKALISKIY